MYHFLQQVNLVSSSFRIATYCAYNNIRLFSITVAHIAAHRDVLFLRTVATVSTLKFSPSSSPRVPRPVSPEQTQPNMTRFKLTPPSTVPFPFSSQRHCYGKLTKRLLAGIYVSRGQDMHLLLFHETVQTDTIASTANHNNTHHSTHAHERDPNAGPDGDTIVATANTPKSAPPLLAASAQGRGPPVIGRPASYIGDNEENDQDRQGGYQPLGAIESHPLSASSHADRGGGGGSASGYGAGSGDGGIHSTASTTGENGRFATAGRVREFRAVLKSAAAHASKMKVRHRYHRCAS